MHIETTVAVNAPADKVWQAVADVVKWPDWTASMHEVSWLTDGGLRLGGRARVRQPGMPPLVWEVCDLQAGGSFTWRVASVGLTTTGIHQVRPLGPDKAELTLVLDQSGPLAWLVGLLAGRRARHSVGLEADGLKRCAEDSTGSSS